MDQVMPLSVFFNAIAGDPRISITHIGVYAALVQYWSDHQFSNPLHAFSYEIMELARISSSTTYHRSIRDLSRYGYINYEPSFKRTRASRVYLKISAVSSKSPKEQTVLSWKLKS